MLKIYISVSGSQFLLVSHIFFFPHILYPHSLAIFVLFYFYIIICAAYQSSLKSLHFHNDQNNNEKNKNNNDKNNHLLPERVIMSMDFKTS